MILDEIDRYILRGCVPVVEPDLFKWGRFMESADRHVGKTQIGDVEVSTVFLGLDHAFGGGPPILFETMVFGGDFEDEMKRYTTWELAAAGHRATVNKIRGNTIRLVTDNTKTG